MNRFLLLAASLLALLCGSAVSRAAGPDDEYVRIHNLVQQADALAEGGRGELARQKYSAAQTELEQVQKAYPGWNELVVQFRLNYVMEKLGSAKMAIRREPAEKTGSASAEPADRIKLLLEQIRQVTVDKELLQAKLKEALSAQPAAVDPRELARSEEKIKSLRKEVEVLTVNLQKAETKPDKPIDPAAFDQTKQGLAAANQKLAHQREIMASLTLERDALQRRLQTFADGTDIKALREENQSLKGRVTELLIEADELKQRLIGPQADSSGKTDSNNDNDSSGRSAANARLLAGEAERAFAARHYDEAERKYAQAMRLDEKNVLIRANLAAAQIGQNRLAEGEANLKRALADDPKNAVSLSLLGVVKVRQHKYDEALDLLGQSARLDPQNAETFQYLGVTLAEKGLGMPAESAFRRAIQLAPENGEAHHNLAIVYATQQPPALELARWHYQKGLASGHPKDSKLEKMLSANKPAAVGGVNASNR
jgi:tetratricopeptide (TPR) repeat protein